MVDIGAGKVNGTRRALVSKGLVIVLHCIGITGGYNKGISIVFEVAFSRGGGYLRGLGARLLVLLIPGITGMGLSITRFIM